MKMAPNRGDLFGAARLFVLLSGGVLAALAQLAILPSLTQMATRFSGGGALDSAAIAQLVMTVAAPAAALGAPVMGWLAARTGKRAALLASALLYTGAGVAGAFAPDIWTLLATRLLVGLASGGFGTAAIAFIGDYYEGERRDRLVGMYSFFGGAGALVGLIVAGKLAEIDWRAPFGLYLIGLPLFLLALPTLRESREEVVTARAVGSGSLEGTYGICVLILALSFVLYMTTVQGPFLLESDGITNPSIQAYVLEIMTFASMVSAFLFGHLRPKLGFMPILVLTWMALGLGTLGFGLSSDLFSFGIFAGVCGFGSGFVAPMTQTAILNIVPPNARTKALGLAFGLFFLAQFLQPIMLAPVRSLVGIHGAFIGVGTLATGIGLLTLLWASRPTGWSGTSGLKRRAALIDPDR